jgi:Cu(I)/Ag(I) efflux system membrane protein CusA/SilA
MYYLGVTPTSCRSAALALAIGVLVDASIVMVENAYRHVSSRARRRRVAQPPVPITARSSARRTGGPAIFFSLAIIIVSFCRSFLLEAQEGRMFRPLAFTKTFAMAAPRARRSRSCRS